jgi:hypothetical protein
MQKKEKTTTSGELATNVLMARQSGRKDIQDLFKAVAFRDGKGARSTSSGGSWVLQVNGITMSSARSRIRRFASLDALQQELDAIGLPNFIVVNAECPLGESIIESSAEG